MPLFVEFFGPETLVGPDGSYAHFQLRDARGSVQHLTFVLRSAKGAPHTILQFGPVSVNADGSPYQLELQKNLVFNGCDHHATDVVAKFEVRR